MAAEGKAGNIVSRTVGFTQDAWAELKKVHPPTRQETTQITIVVLVMVMLFALFLGTTDFIVGTIMRKVLF